MLKLKSTSNCPLNLTVFHNKDLVKVAAGNGLIIGITAEFNIIQAVQNPSFALREKYWTRIHDIAISQYYEGLCIGLVQDGTCIISKRSLRHFSENDINFQRINNTIRSWKNVTQVAVNDAFFALHNDGTVSHVTIRNNIQSPHSDPYAQVSTWKGIKKLVVKSQDGIAGITEDGSVYLAGYITIPRYNPHGERMIQFTKQQKVKDLCFTGSEGEKTCFVGLDGTVTIYPDAPLSADATHIYQCVQSTSWYTILGLNNKNRLCVLLSDFEETKETENWQHIRSFSIGMNSQNHYPFVVALCEQ